MDGKNCFCCLASLSSFNTTQCSSSAPQAAVTKKIKINQYSFNTQKLDIMSFNNRGFVAGLLYWTALGVPNKLTTEFKSASCLLMTHVDKPIFPIRLCASGPPKASSSQEPAEDCGRMKGNYSSLVACGIAAVIWIPGCTRWQHILR